MRTMAATAQNVPRSDGLAVGYRRHRPEQTLLYQIVAQHYPRFAALCMAN